VTVVGVESAPAFNITLMKFGHNHSKCVVTPVALSVRDGQRGSSPKVGRLRGRSIERAVPQNSAVEGMGARARLAPNSRRPLLTEKPHATSTERPTVKEKKTIVTTKPQWAPVKFYEVAVTI